VEAEGPGRDDRARAGVRDHGDDHAAQHVELAPRCARRVLRSLSIRRRVRPPRAGSRCGRAATRADPRRCRGLPADRARGDGAVARATRSDRRARGVDPRRRRPTARRALPSHRPVARRRCAGRGRHPRAVRERARDAARRPLARGDQRQAAVAARRRDRAVSRVRHRDVGSRPRPGQPALRRAVDVARCRRVRVSHGGRVRRCRAATRARGLAARRARGGRSRARTLWWVACGRARQATLELRARERARRAALARADDPDGVPDRRGVPRQRRGVAPGVPRAHADRGAQGARLHRPADRLALPRPGRADRRGRVGARRRARRVGGAMDDRSVRRVLSVPDTDP